MVYTENSKKAVRLCYAGLKNQLSKDGMPVLWDWFVLAERMPDENTTIAALLYGAMKSGLFDLEYIKRQEFPEDALYALEILILDQSLPREEYVARVQTCPIAWIVKHEEAILNCSPGKLEADYSETDPIDQSWTERTELEEKFTVPFCRHSDEVYVKERILNNRPFLDRIRGCMIGGALGDAVGYSGKESDGKEALRFSANTQMCFATAVGFLFAMTHFSTFGFNCTETDCLSGAYRDWVRAQDGRTGPEKSTWILNHPEFCESRNPDKECVSILKVGRCGSMNRVISGSKSWSCLTRVAPAALYSNNSNHRNDHVQYDMEKAASIAAITHGDKMAWLACGLLAHIISRTVFGGCTTGETLNMFLREGKQYLFEVFGDSIELQDLFEIVNLSVELAANGDGDEANIAKLGSGGWEAHETLAIALYCCLRHPLDFEGAISAASAFAENSAAVACVAGQILGARLGYSHLPLKMTSNLERLDVLLEVADDLCDGNQLRRGVKYDDPKWRRKYVDCDFVL